MQSLGTAFTGNSERVDSRMGDSTSRVSSHGKRPKTDNLSKAEFFLSSFIKAKNDLRIYPPTNPVVGESIDKLLASIKKGFGADMLEIAVEKDRLFVDNETMSTTDLRVGKLTLALYRRGVRKIIIDPGIKPPEVRLLLDALSMKVEEIAQAGGIVALMESRGGAHASVEGTAELTIVDEANLPIPDDELFDLEGMEGFDEDMAPMGAPTGFSHMFVRVRDGDAKSIGRLRKLLGNPELFTRMLEKCALQVEKVAGAFDPAERVNRMVAMIRMLGGAIASIPLEDERSGMLKSVAVSVLGLSASLRGEFINQGMVPNLSLKGVESNVLSRFPVTELADVLLENFQISGGAATVMEGYLNSLEIDRSNREELTETLHYSLTQSGSLTPEVEAILKRQAVRVNAEGEPIRRYRPPKPGEARKDFGVPHVDGYPPEKILFQGDERADLIERIGNELEAPPANVMAPALLVLLRHETVPLHYGGLVDHIIDYIEQFLASHEYGRASHLILGLQKERESRAEVFSTIQLKPLDDAIENYMGEKGIRRLTGDLKKMKKESPDFRKMTAYFASLGLPAIRALLGSLEDEESRHVRLLTCQALADIGGEAIGVVAERLGHSQWFVVRNAVSILGQIGTAECVPYLKKALAHAEPRVRREALKGLASIKTDEAIALICDCVQERDLEICKSALGWVAVMQVPQALPAIENLLTNGFIWKADDEAARLAIKALGAINETPAGELLERLSKIKKWFFYRKKAALIREAAAAALSRRKQERGRRRIPA